MRYECRFCPRIRQSEEFMFLHLIFWHSLSESDSVRVIAAGEEAIPWWIKPTMDERGGKLVNLPLDI